MHVTALICTSILGCLVFGLGFAISGLRFKAQRLAGCVEAPDNLLYKCVRAHGNAAEYAPMLALLILCLGARQPTDLDLGLMIGATVARLLHAIGLIAWPSMAKPNPLRFLGAIGTYGFGLGLCARLLAGA